MKLTIHMIQDRLAAYDAQYRPGQDVGQSFAEVRLLSGKGETLVPDTLYVCTAGQLRRAKLEGAERVAFVCVGGDGVEKRSALRGAHVFAVTREGVCLAELMNDLLDLFHRLNDWERRLEEAILRGKSMQELVDLSAPVFENNFFLMWDASYNVLAYTKGVTPPNEKLERVVRQGFFAKEFTDDLVRMDYIKNAMVYTKPTFVSPPNYMNIPFILKTFVVAQRIQYVMSLYYTASVPSRGMADLYQVLANRLEAYIAHWADASRRRSGRTDRCLADLIENPDKGEEYMRDRGVVLGLKEEDAYRLCVVSFQDFTMEQAQYMRMRVRNSCGRPIATIYQEVLVVLFNLGENSLRQQETWAERRQKLFELLPVCKAYAAFSSTLSGCANVTIAYKQAVVAMTYGRRLNPARNMFYYRDAYIYHMIDSYSQHFPLEKMYVQKLALFMDANNYKNSNLYLLRTYLINERNISQTAKLLYMHRNSVIYRIARIRETLNMDLDDPDVRLRLLISFKILELLNPDIFLTNSDRGEAEEHELVGE